MKSLRSVGPGRLGTRESPRGQESQSSRPSSGISLLPRSKRRGRALPLTKNRQDTQDEEEVQESLKKKPKLEDSSQNGDFHGHPADDKTSVSAAIDLQDPPQDVPNVDSSTQQFLMNLLQAQVCDGKVVSLTVTVHGAPVSREYDIASAGVGQDGNQYHCEICHGFGNVVCCDGCPKVYHATCIPQGSPARVALDNDEDPWFCPTCRKDDLSQESPVETADRYHESASRERRTLKRKCNECRGTGGDMINCEGCDVYIHHPSCKPENQEGENGEERLCSNCLVEAVEGNEEEEVGEEEEEEEEEEEDENEEEDDDENEIDETSNTPAFEAASGRKNSRIKSVRAIRNEEDEELSEEISQEGDEEEKEVENPDVDDDDGGAHADDEESPDKKKRKRSDSEAGGSLSKKRRATSFEGSKSKQRDKKRKKKKKKKRLQAVEENESTRKSEYVPRLRLTSKGLVQPTPAFFFFLNDYKMKIERVLARKHRYFNRLPRGFERNELIAREGAHWWVRLRLTEQRRYFNMSMREFEEKVVEWKEEKTIREMSAARDTSDTYAGGPLGCDAEGQDIGPEYEMMRYERHRRLYLSTSVGSKPFTPETGKSNNRVLLELLQDMRFHPMPMFNPLRTDRDSGLMERAKICVPYFEVDGPVATSVGDECSGCTRGWNHFCPVLKRRIPAIEHRARLQPPMSSLMATRVGLGLKTKIPDDTVDIDFRDAELFIPRASVEAEEAKRVPPIPNFSLSHPMSRGDDVICFLEECLAMKVPEPPRPNPREPSVEIQKKSILSRGALPMRGRHKSSGSFDSASAADKADEPSASLNKCGRCRTIIENDTGCIQCRRAQLVINLSKKHGLGANATFDRVNDKALKVQTTMLGRLTVKENNFEEQLKTDRAVANAIIKLRWQPFAVLPPIQTYAPKPDPTPRFSSDRVEIEEVSMHSEGNGIQRVDSTGGERQNASTEPNVAVEDDLLRNNADDEEELEDTAGDDHMQDGNGIRSSSRRSRAQRSQVSAAGMAEPGLETVFFTGPDRQELGQRHKEEAKEVTRRCLNVACCGILLAMVRRDPLCLFAEPVPANVLGYSAVVKNPIDFGKIKTRVQREKYASLGAFMADARLLCINSLAFNPPGSIYSKTAKELHDLLDVVGKRAVKWMNAIKDAHASSFAWKGTDNTDHHEDHEDPFKELRKTWPEAVEMLENSDWLREQVASDFTRTKENESAFYGSIAIRRAAAAAEAALAPYPDSSGAFNAVVRRSHTEDEDLRQQINGKIGRLTAPVQLKEIPRWREDAILRTLRRVQSRRVEGSIMSENGCARCDGIRTESKMALTAVRWGRNKRKGELDTLPRVAESRLALTTGLASMTAQTRLGIEFDGTEVKIKTDKKEESDPDEEKADIEEVLETIETLGEDSILVIHEDEDKKWERINDVAVAVQGSNIHGWGLFADQPFKKGEVVAEYVGEYISNAVADAREKMYQERRIQDYQFRVDENLVIDATLKGGHGRYINHNCNPNCIAKIVDGPKNSKHLKRVMIIAQRDIKAREEITYDYQFPLELDLDNRIPCNCGSLLCRGFMNWDLPEKGSKNRVLRTQKRGGNMRDRIRRLGRPLKKQGFD